jgi:hypothetical protein
MSDFQRSAGIWLDESRHRLQAILVAIGKLHLKARRLGPKIP